MKEIKEISNGIRIADSWQDYRLLDATGGFRLERWGKILLQRPDPQVLWNAPKTSPLWDEVDAVYHRSDSGGGHWEYKKRFSEKWKIAYDDFTMIVSPTGFKHTGVFPEQGVNWDKYTKWIKGAKRPINVLNLFGYTGGASLACAAAGASVTHVDASKGMVAWARENAAASGLSDRPVRWIVDDCQKFVAREIRRGKQYDAIIMDPPSYGRGPGGEVWKLEEALWPLLEQSVKLLSDNPLFFVVNSYTTGFAPGAVGYMLHTLFGGKFGGCLHSGEIGLPVEATGGVLPCGATAFWCAEL